MAEGFIQVPPDSTGKKAHTWSRVIGANTVEDEVIVQGEQYLPSYSVVTAAIIANTGNDHLLQIMAGAALKVRMRRILVELLGVPAAAATMSIHLFRLTTAGTGGTVITPLPLDTPDGPSGFTAMSQPTVKGAEAAAAMRKWSLGAPAAQPATSLHRFEWHQLPMQKPIVIQAGVTSGLALKLIVVGGAAASVVITIDADESSF